MPGPWSIQMSFAIFVRRLLLELGTNALIVQVWPHSLPFSALGFTDGLYVDFDLCSSCLATQPQSIGSHSSSHSLFEIEEAGGVWVHTVFRGDGTPDIPEPLSTREEPEPPATNEGPAEAPNTTSDTQGESTTTPVAESEVALHHAACNLCESAIEGDRFVSVVHNAQIVALTLPTEVFRLPRFRYVRFVLRDRTQSTPWS